MKTSTLVIILVVALILGAGVAAVLIGGRVFTQVAQEQTPCPATTDDLDGDCTPNFQDFYPNDPER